MANIKPSDLILRCYGYEQKDGKWFGLCLDLNLAVEAHSQEHLRHKMKDAIVSYFYAVYDSEDEGSIPQLLMRRAPIKDWVLYYLIKLLIIWRNIFTFNEILPLHPSHAC